MIHYIANDYSISAMARSASTSVFNWCYYAEYKKKFNNTEFNYGTKLIMGSGIHWYFLYDCGYTKEKLMSQQKSNTNFLITRNPIDRFISSYNFLKNNKHSNVNIILQDVSLAQFITNIESFRKNKFIKMHTDPYSIYIKDFPENFFTYIDISKLYQIKEFIEKRHTCVIPKELVTLNTSKNKVAVDSNTIKLISKYYENDISILF